MVFAFVLSSSGALMAEKSKGEETPMVKAPEKAAFSDALNLESILKVSNVVADWQLAHPYERADWDWTEGALWTGLTAHAITTGNEKYYDAMKKVSEDLKYQLGPRRGFGDDHCVGQLHLWNYMRDEMPRQLAPTKEVIDAFVVRPHDEPLLWVNKIHLREWAWCDSMYMSPPTLAMLFSATGDRKYIDTMDQLWWKTYDYLYDKEAHLYWRDSSYFKKREANGEKMFWSRGNGWVFAGLPHVLQNMPADYPTRPRYVQLFKEMAAKLKSLQMKDGSWRASLLDPGSYPSPETSGTAFFTYGFLWGVNNGILDEKEYLPAALKGWKRLVRNVHADGMLGFVQPVGADPRKVSFDQTAVYGVGGFLLCAHELDKHLILSQSKLAKLSATNPSNVNRLNEVVRIDWKTVQGKLPSVTVKNVGIRDQVSGYFLPTQVVDDNQDGTPDALLFQTNLTPKETRNYQLCAFGESKPKFRPSQLTARFVPERMDDFAWENDRIAFRTYGPALAVEGSRGGIDVWSKSVRTPVVDEWYKSEAYHKDRGTGLDGYHVGSMLGCGGLGYLTAEENLVTSPVYAKWKILEKGPLRLKFELKYNPVQVDDAKIAETRTITMLAGKHSFKVNSSFKVDGDVSKIKPVAALSVRKAKAKPEIVSGQFLGYWDPCMAEKHGYIGTFLLNDDKAANGYQVKMSKKSGPKAHKEYQAVKILSPKVGEPVQYYAGAVWQKVDAEEIGDFELLLYRENNKSRYPVTVK